MSHTNKVRVDPNHVIDINLSSTQIKTKKVSLINKVCGYAKQCKNSYFIIWMNVLIQIFGNLVMTFLTHSMANGNKDFINIIIAIRLFISFIQKFVLKPITIETASRVRIMFCNDSHEKYNSMSFLSKNKKPISEFENKMSRSSFSFYVLIEWGLSTVCHLCGSIVSSLIMFVILDLIWELIFVFVLMAIIYWFYIKRKQAVYSKLDSELRKQNDKIRRKKMLLLPSFQYKETSCETITKLDNQIDENVIVRDVQRVKIIESSTFLIEISTTLIALSTNSETVKFMLVLAEISKLGGAFGEVSSFVSQYDRFEQEYAEFADFWKDVEFIDDPVDLELPRELSIINADIKGDKIHVHFDVNVKEINFNDGSKTLIKGPTNHGKTTFVNALIGKIHGVTLSEGESGNYFHTVADMFQNIREKMSFSKMTLRNFFWDDQDNQLIYECLDLCFRPDEIKKMVLDVELDEKISGGAKSRLCLATRAYQIIKHKKGILILDEPEQGSDPDMAVWIVNVGLCPTSITFFEGSIIFVSC